jgi:hypothetical protein
VAFRLPPVWRGHLPWALRLVGARWPRDIIDVKSLDARATYR